MTAQKKQYESLEDVYAYEDVAQEGYTPLMIGKKWEFDFHSLCQRCKFPGDYWDSRGKCQCTPEKTRVNYEMTLVQIKGNPVKMIPKDCEYTITHKKGNLKTCSKNSELRMDEEMKIFECMVRRENDDVLEEEQPIVFTIKANEFGKLDGIVQDQLRSMFKVLPVFNLFKGFRTTTGMGATSYCDFFESLVETYKKEKPECENIEAECAHVSRKKKKGKN